MNDRIIEEAHEKLKEQKGLMDLIIYKESIKRDKTNFLYVPLSIHYSETPLTSSVTSFVKFDFKNNRIDELEIREFGIASNIIEIYREKL